MKILERSIINTPPVFASMEHNFKASESLKPVIFPYEGLVLIKISEILEQLWEK